MKRYAAIAVLCLICVASAAPLQDQRNRQTMNREHTQWIAAALQSMQTIKVGMTRADLMRIVTTEGGLSTASQRTYVYRECPYIKIDVKFKVSNRMEELPQDKILEISRPYLAWSIAD